MIEDSVIIRFANEEETYVSIDIAKEWDIVKTSSVGDTHFCRVGDTHFSISSEELRKIPKNTRKCAKINEILIREIKK